MYNILCDAVPFCFGPISKLLTVSEKLTDFAELTLLTSATSKELGKNGPYTQVIDCNTEDVKELEKNRSIFESADLFVSVMNPVSTKFAKCCGTPVAQIDSLFWMWDNISPETVQSELYFIQNFDGVKEQMEKFKDKLRNPILVGPIVMEKPVTKNKKNQLVVNFGGIESALIKIGKNSNYPFTVSRILFDILESQNDFDSVLFVGLDKIMKQLEKNSKLKNARFAFLEHKEFLKELAESRLLLTSPGLTTSFEAFSFGIPTVFLPPQNYSQYWNIEKFKKHSLVCQDTGWADLIPELGIGENEPEEEGVKKVLEAIRKFDKEKKIQQKVKKRISKSLSITQNEIRELRKKQCQYFESLGGNGTDKVVEGIKKFLAGK